MAAGSVLQTLREIAPTVSAGVLAADLMHLARDLALLETTDVRLLHFDVMDGCFCPAMTAGPPLIKAVKTPLVKDVHLMIADPLAKLEDYVGAGADIITVHLESCPTHIHQVFQMLGRMENANDPARGIVRGLALNPETPVQAVVPLLDEIEMVVLLAINPGWGGQKFLQSTRTRIEKARRMSRESGREIIIGVDGGVTRDNIAEIAAMKPDLVVAGSAIFDGKAPAENARYILGALKGG
jgi:ribulose-phosphate 3-epimerase